MENVIADLGVLSILIGIWVLIFWPAFLFYVVWRVLHDLRRIADALEVRERLPDTSSPLPSSTVTTEVVGGIQRITNSAFGR